MGCRKHHQRFCLWCIGTTLSFPLEHVIWMRVPLMRSVAHLVGV